MMSEPVPQVLDNTKILQKFRESFEKSLAINDITEKQVENKFKHLLYNPKINSEEGISRLSDYINSLQDALGEDPFPVYHKFGGGMYTREIHMPKGYAVVGKLHKHESMVYMLKGRVIVADKEGTRIVEAPTQFVSKGGIKRVGYVIEDVVWIDIHATKETTVEKAEIDIFENEMDYSLMIEALGVSETEVETTSENQDDIIEIENKLIEVKDSVIDKKGIFLTKKVSCGECVGASRIGLMRTELGRYVNHSFTPNVKCDIDSNAIYFVSSKEINKDEEITIDYREAFNFARKLDSILDNYMKGDLCQV